MFFKNINFSASNAIKDIQGVIKNSSWGGNRPIIIITGGLGEGKSTYLENLINFLGSVKGLTFRRFVAKGIGLPPLCEGYSLKVLPHGNEQMLCRRVGPCGLPSKSFEFNQEVVKELTKELIAIKSDDILIIDEVGLTKTQNILILTVRRENLMHVAEWWKLNDAYVFDINKASVNDTAHSIKSLVLSYLASGC
jgi:hypothetical protein